MDDTTRCCYSAFVPPISVRKSNYYVSLTPLRQNSRQRKQRFFSRKSGVANALRNYATFGYGSLLKAMCKITKCVRNMQTF